MLEHLDQITPGRDRLGPAYGVYQIEPAAHRDLFANILIGERWLALRRRVLELRAYRPTADNRVPEALPEADDVDGLGSYWKRHNNTAAGVSPPPEVVRRAGRPEDFRKAFARLPV